MSDMTISQALRRIKKLKGQLGEYRMRAHNAVTHLADQQPAYLFGASREQATTVLEELLKLQTATAIANAKTSIEWEGKSIPLAHAVRTLRELAAEIDWVKKLPVRAQEVTVEYERDHDGEKWVNTQKKFTCWLPEAKRADLANELQERFDKLNDIVETTNHKTVI